MRVFLVFSLAMLVIASSLFSFSENVKANSKLTLILLDLSSTRDNIAINDQAKTAVAMVTTLTQDGNLTVGYFGPKPIFSDIVTIGTKESSSLTNKILVDLSNPQQSISTNLLTTLNDSFQKLLSEGATEESALFVISNTASLEIPIAEVNTFNHLLSRFNQKGWEINTIYLPGDESSASSLSNLSKLTGGNSFDTTFPSGLQRLASNLIGSNGEEILVNLNSGNLKDNNNIETYDIPVAPNTEVTNFIFLKDSNSIAASLIEPVGSGVTRPSSIISVDSPFALIKRVLKPAQGVWQARIQGSNGNYLAFYNNLNRLKLVLETKGAIPKDAPTIITASVREADSKVSIQGGKYFAEITSPTGNKAVYNLNDKGIEGDKISGDKFYSIRIPPLTEVGNYEVILKLNWPALGSNLTTKSIFGVEAFPKIDLQIVPEYELTPGRPSRIATVDVSIDGKAFPIYANQITATATRFDGTSIPVEITARQVFGEGRAWSYYATIIPSSTGQHNLNVELNANYMGRDFVVFANQLMIDVPDIAPIIPIEITNFIPVWSITLIIIAILVLLWLTIWISKIRPYGYLYDDRGNQVVSFRELSQSIFMKLFLKNTIYGTITNIPSLNSITFKFNRMNVQIFQSKRTHTIRVNNQPVTGHVELTERAWIGTQGQLFMFMTERTTESLSVLQNDVQSIAETS